MATKKATTKKKITSRDLFSLRYFLIADDVRIERQTDKLFIVGMYTDTIRLGASVEVLPTIALLFGVQRNTKQLPTTAIFSLHSGHEDLVPETAFPVVTVNDDATVHNFILRAAALPLRDEYIARLKVDGAYILEGRFRASVDPAGVARQLAR